MASFGKKGVSNAAPEWPRRAHDPLPAKIRPAPGSPAVPSPEEEARFRFWRKVSIVCCCFYLLAACAFGLAMFMSPFFWLSKWYGSSSLQYFGYVLIGMCIIALLLNIVAAGICGLHRARYPVGLQAYMHRNPIVYAAGTFVGVTSFLLLSDYSVGDLIAHFNVNDVLGFGADREARRPWQDFMAHILAAWLGVGAVFYGLDKLHGGESR